MKFLCSIVLVQRLWKGRSVKKLIHEYISPRSNPECVLTGELRPVCDLSLTTEAQTAELIRKYHNISV